jgi:hypothetical protein
MTSACDDGVAVLQGSVPPYSTSGPSWTGQVTVAAALLDLGAPGGDGSTGLVLGTFHPGFSAMRVSMAVLPSWRRQGKLVEEQAALRT